MNVPGRESFRKITKKSFPSEPYVQTDERREHGTPPFLASVKVDEPNCHCDRGPACQSENLTGDLSQVACEENVTRNAI